MLYVLVSGYPIATMPRIIFINSQLIYVSHIRYDSPFPWLSEMMFNLLRGIHLVTKVYLRRSDEDL